MFKVVFIEKIELIIILQLPENGEDFSLFVKFLANVKVLDILEIETEVIFAISGEDAFAKFSGKVSIDGGDVLGEAIVTVLAQVEIGDYLNSTERRASSFESIAPSTSTNNTSRDLQVANLLDADWELDIDFEYKPPQWIKDVGEAIAAGVQEAGKAIEKTWNDITDFVEKALYEIIGFARFLGEEIALIFDAIGDTVAAVGDAVEGAIDSLAALFGGGGTGPLADLLGGAADVAGFAFDVLQSGLGVASAILTGKFDEIDDFLWDTFSSSDFKYTKPAKVIGYFGCVKIYKGELEELFQLPNYIGHIAYSKILLTQVVVYKECAGGFNIGFNCKNKSYGPFENQECVTEKATILTNISKRAMDAKEKKECRNDSKMRNQGLSYAATANVDDLRSQITPELSFSTMQLGKTSDIEGKGACAPLPYTLRVNTLSPTDPNGFSGEPKNFSSSTSQCFDFSSAESLENTLPLLDEEKDKVSDAAKDVVIGDQGIGKDTDLQECKNSVDGLENCIPVEIIDGGEGFQSQATISCGFANPNFNNLFGKVEFSKDPRCSDPIQTFSIAKASPPEFVCGARSMEIERTVEDCCGFKASITHLLKIEQVPPTITQVIGSMDKTLSCDANIHSSEFGQPSFNGGCRLANTKVMLSQTDPSFNLDTCTTTLQRTFRISENNCEEQAQNFVQTITLENNYDPQFDFFPPDKTIEVFDSYGTNALGFPTAFQQCGLPVEITYSDDISEGSCFAERVLRRTFRAVDSCGHSTEKVQVLTISNDANSLPLGRTSLARLYGHNKLNAYLEEDKFTKSSKAKDAKSSKSSKGCIIPSDKCGIYGAPEYKCAKNTKNTDKFAKVRKKFSTYQSRLAGFHDQLLSEGPIIVTCYCSEGDGSCDKREQQGEDPSDPIYFGTAVTTNSGTCDVLNSANPDNVGKETLEEIDCPIPAKNEQSSKSIQDTSCNKKTLSGSNPIYNIFEITVNDFSDKTIFIDVPPTSVVLVNVIVPADIVGETIYLAQNSSKGVVLGQGVLAHNLIWNIIDEIDLSLRYPKRVDWAFHGTLLNPYGKMKLKTSKGSPIVWKGQLFAYHINAYQDFQCGGHFAGFASCKDLISNENV